MFLLIYLFFCASPCVFQHTLAEVWVQKTSELDTSQQYHCRTFLGHLLNIGDLVLGWVWGHRRWCRVPPAATLRPPSHFARVAPQVWLCQFQHQRWEPEQDEPSPRSRRGESLRGFRKTSSETLTSSGSLKMLNFWEEYHIRLYLYLKMFEFYSLPL